MTAEIHHFENYRAPAVLPKALTELKSWLVWRLVQKPGEKKPRKVPFYASGAPRGWPNGRPHDGVPTEAQPQVKQGTPLDRGALVSYERAVAACEKGKYSGLGLAVLAGDHVVALDFDHCVDKGVIDPRVAVLVSDTYAEISPSGTGVRAFMRGDIASKKDNADTVARNPDGTRIDGLFDVEFFGDTGFVTITGNPTPECEMFGLHDTMQDVTPEVMALYRQRFGTVTALTIRSEQDDADLLTLASPPLGWTLDEGREILFACDPSASREKWLKALMAMHHEFAGTEEALDICDEWSAQGSSYSGRSDVEGRWRSFGRGSSKGTTTGVWLLHWRKECSAHLKYNAVAEHKSEIAAAKDEFTLRERICPEIAKDHRLDDLGREALAQALLSAFTSLGSKYPIAQCRKLLAEKRPEKHSGGSVPDWLKGWVYVSDDDQFFRMDSDEWVSMQGFNARFNREVPVGEDGTITKSAAWVALENYAIPTVTRALYLPWADKLFDLDGVQCVNSYRKSSVPEATKHMTSDGQRAVSIVLNHLRLLCGGREEVVQTFVDWMAHNVQHPGVKIRWAPLVKGVEGDGKTVMGSLMAAVMGRGNVRNVSPKVLGTDFTGWAEGACVAVLEEIKLTGHNRYDILNALKPFVTNDSVEVHRKGKDTYDIVNTTNYVAFTNYADALPLTDTDRRWWIVFSPFASGKEMAALIRRQVGGAVADRDLLGNYFDALHEAIHTCRADLRRWLLDWPISAGFKPNGSAPMTEEKGVMIGMSVSDEEMTVRELMEKGGPGYTENAFVSSYLRNAVINTGADIDLATSSWNLLLKRLGFTKWPKRVKFNGATEIIWTKQTALGGIEAVISALNETLTSNRDGDTVDGLFG